MSSGPSNGQGSARFLYLTLTAVGVVYGDIGTSPLYTIRECFFGSHSVPPTHDNVLGVLSLIIYALLIVVSIKDIAVVMRADNQGEGGILALTALLPPESGPQGTKARTSILVLCGIFGAALLYGDGMITPAITVLSAVEGLHLATPFFDPYVVPAAIVILVILFLIQQHGTHRVGRLFGPVMVIWFATLAVLGLSWIVRYPAVLEAIGPWHAVRFFTEHGFHGFAVLGAVFLAVTGAEALYADMGHFGKKPIRAAWFALVLPSLLLNYFGQGAMLLINPQADQPFFMLAPSWALLPLVGLSAVAAVVASQALISGAFSLTRQGIQLGYVPRLDIEHTSSDEMGQVYVPQVCWGLMIATIVITLGFRSSSALAAAYGIAVSLTMLVTALLLHVVAIERWKWPKPVAYLTTGIFLTIDIAFLGANLLKLFQGGWLPLIIGAGIFTLMTTWKTGRRLVAERITARTIPIESFMAGIRADPPVRVPGTAVFMTASPKGTPPALMHNLKYNKVLHEHVVVLSVQTVPTPYVTPEDFVNVDSLGEGIFNVRVRYGFMQDPNVPEALKEAQKAGLRMDDYDLTFFLGRETIIITSHAGMATWRERLFVLMARNAVRATAFFRLPTERVVELGVQVEDVALTQIGGPAVGKEFREFIARGNVVDLAVGVIVGAAFGKIVTSLVEGIVMPPIGLVLGRIDFTSLFYVLDTAKGVPASLADAKTKGVPVIAYGQFINDIIGFLIVAFAVFLMVKQVNRLKTAFGDPEPALTPNTKACSFCVSTIPLKATRCPNCTSQL